MKTSVTTYKRTALVLALLLPAILLLVLPFYKPGELPYLLLFIGRFHPVLLHFPIVLIILALVLELMRRFRVVKKTDTVTAIILLAAALSAVIAIGSGFLLYASGDYSGKLPGQHFWFGVISGTSILFTAALFFIHRYTTKFYSLYLIVLLVSNGTVAYTSHLGGTLTHGQDYLTEYLPLVTGHTNTGSIKSESEMLVYEDMIVPVMEAKCVSCHNETRAKGDLSMVSLQNIIKGGESGNAGILPGNADSSELYKRLLLPEDHEDRMPPKGKTPLTDAETALIRFWISSGAKLKVKVAEVRKDSAVNAMVSHILPELKRYRRKQQIALLKNQQLKRDLDKLAQQLNIRIERDTAAEENYFTVAMKFPPAPFTNAQFRELLPYGNVFSKLSLVSSGIEDDGLYYIGQMENVSALFLQKTKLKGSGLIYLQHLEKLEVLNLSYTQIDDKSVLDLLKIPNLREVYLFQTKTSPDVLKALQEYRPSLKILKEEGPYF